MMCATRSNISRGAALRIEQVDNWHRSWDVVLKLIARQGAVKKLRIDKDGWLSARQVLMVAFVNNAPAAFVSFIVTPTKDACIEARHVSHGIDPKRVGRGIESQLYHAALERTKALGCEKLRGFRFGSKWH
jgi:hypothetical protein